MAVGDDKEKQLGKAFDKKLILVKAMHSTISVPGDDVSRYNSSNPSVQPDATQYTVSFDELERIYWQDALIHKGINVRADRILGDGFTLEPAKEEGIDRGLAELAARLCKLFLDKIHYRTFFRGSIINALVAGNEWTEPIRNIEKRVIDAKHGDFRTIDFRRDFIYNDILFGKDGKPVGYWQYIPNLSKLHQALSTLMGSEETLENWKNAQLRLEKGIADENGKVINVYEIKDSDGNVIGAIAKKPQYMFLERGEIVHLAFKRLNDTPWGVSAIIPCYNSINRLNNVMAGISEYIMGMGFPKIVAGIGDEKKEPTPQMAELAESMIQDPVRKEGYVEPYPMKLRYLGSPSSGDISAYPEWFVTDISVGIGVPKEQLLGDGGSNRATAIQGSSDFDRSILADRAIFEEYVHEFLEVFLNSYSKFETGRKRNPYVPKIVWPELMSEDEKLRQEIIMKDLEMGLITLNEARVLRGYDETEDVETGDVYLFEIKRRENEAKPNIGDAGINPGEDAKPKTSEVEPQSKSEALQAVHARHSLMKKGELNPSLNDEFGTEGVDYKAIAQKNVGTKITSVGQSRAKKIRDYLVNGMAKGKSMKSIKENIKKEGGYTDAHTKLVVRTEMQNLRGEANLEDARKSGMKFKRWFSRDDADVSPLCKALHGQVQPIDKPFKARYKEGKKVKTWQGETTPAHPGCRSKAKYYATEEDARRDN